MSVRILLVEDELAIAQPLIFLLEREGFTVTHAADGEAAVSLFNPNDFELVLLDLMLPKLAGTEVCKQIRAQAQTPIVMLSAKDSEVDIVVGLELGADDYVTKPYSTAELLARVRAVLRRSDRAGTALDYAEDEVLTLQGITLNRQRHTVQVHGQEVAMPLREFELLEYLMHNAGRVLTRAQLLDRVWGANYFGDSKTLDVHIKRIRTRIEADPANPQLLTTVRGVGYRFG